MTMMLFLLLATLVPPPGHGACPTSAGRVQGIRAGSLKAKPATFARVLKEVRPGGEIVLEPGDYSAASLVALRFGKPITIRSRSISSKAKFGGLLIRGSSGVNVCAVELQAGPSGSRYPFQILDSQDIVLSGIDIHGSLNGNPMDDDMIGLRVKGNKRVSIAHSHFHELEAGIHAGENDGLSIVGNTFETIAKDGIQHGLNGSSIVISQNLFANFQRPEKAHSDAIQFSTHSVTRPVSDVTIADNVIIQGRGSAMQGIFVGNEKSVPYSKLIITGNLIAGGHWHGITVNMADGVEVSGNTVLSTGGKMQSRISLKGVRGAMVRGNRAASIGLNGTDMTGSGNERLSSVTSDVRSMIDGWIGKRASRLRDLPRMR